MLKYKNQAIDVIDKKICLKKRENYWIENSIDSHTIDFYKKDLGELTLSFSDAKIKEEKIVDNSLYLGFETLYSSFPNFENFSFKTSILIDKNDESFIFQIEPCDDSSSFLRCIKWPSPFEFNKIGRENYAVVNICQGSLLVNGSDDEIIARERWDLESGYNFTRTNYMPWYALVRGNETLYAQYLDPFDTGFDIEKRKKECAKIYHIAHSQLGKIGYLRRLKIKLLNNVNYNDVAKEYRAYLIDTGKFVSLKEKIQKNKKVEDLIGSSLIHTDIYHKYSPVCFDVVHKNILEKEKIVLFEERKKQIERIRELGIEKAYVHLDGWNNQGYDNQHPDTFPPTQKAGGIEKMKELIESIHQCGYLFGIHDQYRDFYLDSPSYDSKYSIVKFNNEKYQCSLWEGGLHEALNPIFSYNYVKRNFDLYRNNDLKLDGAYLDVFSVIALDESYSKNYPLTRENCAKYRALCFEEVRRRKLLIQSEEGSSWAIPHLDFTHHLPYWMVTSEDENQMIGKIEDRAIGIPVPLSTLVFHDCIITPWTNDNKKWKGCSSSALMAIIHGGIPYVDIDIEEKDVDDIKKAMKFNELVCFEQMINHEYLDSDYTIHHCTYSSGIECIVNTETNKFQIKKDDKLILEN